MDFCMEEALGLDWPLLRCGGGKQGAGLAPTKVLGWPEQAGAA